MLKCSPRSEEVRPVPVLYPTPSIRKFSPDDAERRYVFLPGILPLAIPRSSRFSKCRVITLPLKYFTRSLTSVCLLHSFIPAFVPFVYYACCKNSFMPPRYLPPPLPGQFSSMFPHPIDLPRKAIQIESTRPCAGSDITSSPEDMLQFLRMSRVSAVCL